MTQKEIFNLIATGLLADIPKQLQFKEAILNIICLKNTVEFSSYIVDENNKKVYLQVSMGYKYAKAILELYNITQTEAPIHKNWNRAIFTLFPDAKMTIDYIWDDGLQNEVDKHNQNS